MSSCSDLIDHLNVQLVFTHSYSSPVNMKTNKKGFSSSNPSPNTTLIQH